MEKTLVEILIINLIKKNIDKLDEVLENAILQILEDNQIDLSDDELKEKFLLLAKQTYFAG